MQQTESLAISKAIVTPLVADLISKGFALSLDSGSFSRFQGHVTFENDGHLYVLGIEEVPFDLADESSFMDFWYARKYTIKFYEMIRFLTFEETDLVDISEVAYTFKEKLMSKEDMEQLIKESK